MSDRAVFRRKPFFLGVVVGVIVGMSLGSALAAVFGDDVSVLVRRLIKRIAGERAEPNLQILLQ